MSERISIIELSRMTPGELHRDLKGKRAEMAKIRLGLVMGSEKNHAKYKLMKRDVARMTMVLRAMEKKGMDKSKEMMVSETPEKASKPSKKPVKRAAK